MDAKSARLLEKVALSTRFAFLILSALCNFLVPDHKSDGYASPGTLEEGFLDKVVNLLFGGLCRWDSEHFLHVSLYGYTYETNLAFFPFFPITANLGSNFLGWALGLNFRSGFILVSVLLNTFLFIKSTVTLYELTRLLFKNEQFAFNSALFFCISPASIFFIAPYSETMYVFFTLNGMLAYAKRHIAYSTIWFCISSCIRSNGILNVGFILHFFFSIAVQLVKSYERLSLKVLLWNIRKIVIFSVFSLLLISFPYLIFQIDGYYRFCKNGHNYPQHIIDYAQQKDLPMPGSRPVWCNDYIPMPYSYVQSEYWNVGFLKYYEFKQIPNFCLAYPIVYIMLYYGARHLLNNIRLFVNADLVYSSNDDFDVEAFPKRIFPFVAHSVFLTLFCLLTINVQVTTRMLASSSPVLYWIASLNLLTKENGLIPTFEYIVKNLFDFKESFRPSCQFYIYYFLSYSVVGTVLFSNNYPWT